MWNGSLHHISHCLGASLELITIANSSKGGLSVVGSNATIIRGEFEGNDPKIDEYPSARRNIICTASNHQSNVSSLKGGDGLQHKTSV